METPTKDTIGFVLNQMGQELQKNEKIKGNKNTDEVVNSFVNELIESSKDIPLELPTNASDDVRAIYKNLVQFFLYYVANSARGLILRGYSDLSGQMFADAKSRSVRESQNIIKYIQDFRTYVEKDRLRGFLVKLQNEFNLLNIDASDDIIINDLKNKCKNSTLYSASAISVRPKNLDADKEKCKDIYSQVQAIRAENAVMIQKILEIKNELVNAKKNEVLHGQLLAFIQQYNLDELNYKVGTNTLIDCENNPKWKIAQLITERDNLLQNNHVEIFKNLVNFKEDLLGAVRIFVKVKGGQLNVSKQVNISYPFNALGTLTRPLQDDLQGNRYIKFGEDTVKGPFFDVFEPDKSNTYVFDKINNLIKQIESGYQVAIFGYGYSGSGKTYTLIDGTEGDKGLLYAMIGHFISNKINVTINEIFELYIGDLFLDKSGVKNSKPSLTGRKISHTVYTSRQINTILDLTEILTKITTRRKNGIVDIGNETPARITETLNNPESSRSHLFVKFNIGEGGLTICDMGGREDPFEIFQYTPIKLIVNQDAKTELRTIPSRDFFGSSPFNTIYEQYINNWPYFINARIKRIGKQNEGITMETKAEDIMERCKEGVFINETINHLKSYFQFKKTGKFSDVTPCEIFNKYKSDQVFVNPQTLIVNPMQPDKIGMITALRKLENKDSSKPTKFVMFACIRRENTDKFVEFSKKTLDFAQEIASTT